MAKRDSIDSNVVGLRFAEEASLKTLPGSPVWYPLEPNSYENFGGEITTIARAPISADRQNKKGSTTDLDAGGGIVQDLTQDNLQRLLQGFFFADIRTKVELAVATVDGTNDDYEPASGGDGYYDNDLLFAKDFDDAANNGLKKVTGSPSGSSVAVEQDLVAATSQSGIISRVGHEFASGDLQVDASGSLPKLTASSKNLTQLGLVPGEWIFVGGDLTAEKFATAANNGFARVRSVASGEIVLDKTAGTMVTDNGSGKTIRLFFGRVLKNESDTSLIKRRSYQLERTLGAPDDALPAQIQSEYVVGAIANQLTLNIPVANLVTANLSFVGLDNETRDGATGVKSGTRPTLADSDGFNTSSDFSRIKLAKVESADAAPTALFAFVDNLTLTINNNARPNKAVGVLGAFDVSVGNFDVSAEMGAYFADVAATQAVRDNADVTLDAALVKANKGIVIDLPLVALGGGRLDPVKDEKIKVPLTSNAATGAKINTNLNHTLLMSFFDYLPSAADV